MNAAGSTESRATTASEQERLRMAALHQDSEAIRKTLELMNGYSPDECMRLRSRLLVMRIWMIAGWLTAAVLLSLSR